MSTETWAIVVGSTINAIAIVAVPIIEDRIRSRRHHPKPTPDTSIPPKDRHGVADRLLAFMVSSWFLLPLMAINTYFLVIQVRSPEPLDRWSVFGIVQAAIGVALGLVWMTVFGLNGTLSDGIAELSDQTAKTDRLAIDKMSKMTETMGGIVEYLRLVSDKKPAQDVLDRLRLAMRRLLD